MKLTLSIAKKLQLLRNGELLPASSLKHESIAQMLENGVLQVQLKGRSRKLYYLRSADGLHSFLQNHFGINNLDQYVNALENENLNRAEAIEAASDSKLKQIRTFKGFLVNAIQPIRCQLNGAEIVINPPEGTFSFIYDYENFSVPDDTLIVGVENPENFRFIHKQKALFATEKCLFVSRYPQSKDLVQWLESIPNQYLHFGDFDFAGLNIYVNEFKKHLGERASFLLPENIEALLAKYGNRALYHNQSLQPSASAVEESAVVQLIKLIEKHKKGLEQEILISGGF